MNYFDILKISIWVDFGCCKLLNVKNYLSIWSHCVGNNLELSYSYTKPISVLHINQFSMVHLHSKSLPTIHTQHIHNQPLLCQCLMHTHSRTHSRIHFLLHFSCFIVLLMCVSCAESQGGSCLQTHDAMPRPLPLLSV